MEVAEHQQLNVLLCHSVCVGHDVHNGHHLSSVDPVTQDS